MKFPALATLALIAGPAAAEVYFKEQFNDDVSLEGSDVSDCALRPNPANLGGREGQGPAHYEMTW